MVSTIQSLWKDRLTVTEYHKVIQPNQSTGFEEVDVLTNQPCKLSFSTLQAAGQDESGARIVQVVKLFLDKTVTIKPASKLTITRDGQTFIFKQSGLPGMFSKHQEIVLVPFQGWA